MALTKCNVQKDVIGSLGTNPSERGLTTQQFKDKFDEMPEGIIDYLNNTLTEEIDSLNNTLTEEIAPLAEKVATLANKNLLHNWDFRNPVNQRGQSSYSGAQGYCIDRWIRETNITVALESGGLVLTSSGATSNFFYQKIENTAGLLGSTVTFSVEVNGEISSITAEIPASISGTIGAQTTAWGSFGLTAAGGFLVPYLSIPSGSVTLRRAKLELGTVSTLANDPPADYGEELRKCQRYYVAFGGNDAYEKFGVGVYAGSTQFLLTIPLKVEMRANPTVTATGNFILSPGGPAITGVNITNEGSTAKTGSLLVQGFSGKTAGQSARLEANNDLNARIVFSAEL